MSKNNMLETVAFAYHDDLGSETYIKRGEVLDVCESCFRKVELSHEEYYKILCCAHKMCFVRKTAIDFDDYIHSTNEKEQRPPFKVCVQIALVAFLYYQK